jgi:hypothetical protein
LLEDLKAVEMNQGELGRCGAFPAVGVAAQQTAIDPRDGMTWLGESEGSGVAAVPKDYECALICIYSREPKRQAYVLSHVRASLPYLSKCYNGDEAQDGHRQRRWCPPS